ncbi:MAG: glycosyltransferase [Chloroflexales bacterium]
MHPLISVIIPAYNSDVTIPRSLRALSAQRGVRYEIILVDSSPSNLLGPLLREQFPQVRYIHSAERLLPHAARNLGAAAARGDLLAFTDPDAYAHPDWLRQLMAAYTATGHIIVGAVACYGRRWFDQGVHFTKYDKWLPGGVPRPIDVAPTVNALYNRNIFLRSGGFQGTMMLGDTDLSWRMREQGAVLWFAPRAVVEHHHLADWGSFLSERYDRGQQQGQLRAGAHRWGKLRLGLWFLSSILLLRVLSQLLSSAQCAARSGVIGRFLITLPVITAGRTAWVLGEAHGYLDCLRADPGVERLLAELPQPQVP